MVHHQLVKEDGLYVTKVFLPFKNSNKEEKVAFVVDTGAVITLVDTTIIHLLGYSAHEDGIRRSTLGGAAGQSVGFIVKLPRFRCLDFEMKDFEIACHDLDTKLGVAGLLGMNFLSHFRMDVDFHSGEIFWMEKVVV